MVQHPKMAWTYAGVDSHKATHTIVLINCFFEKLGEITISSAPSGFDAFYEEVQKYRLDGTKIAWGFEDTTSYGRTLVRYLVDKGELVKHCDATIVAAERNAKSILNKNDSVDAECAARVLLNRFDQLPIANQEEKFFILQTLVTRRNTIARMLHIGKRQLHSYIYENYPSYKKFFSKIDGKGALNFFEAYPSPQALQNETVESLKKFLIKASRRSFSTKKAELILELVKADEVQPLAFQIARDFSIKSIARQMKFAQAELAGIENQITDFLVHFDYNLRQMKGITELTEAMFIAYIGDISRFKNASALAKYAGISPVTHASGSNSVDYANKQGNRKLNQLFYRLAIIQALPRGKDYFLVNPTFHEYYRKKMLEGKTQRQAIKCVQRRLVNMIYSMMKHKRPYTDPPLGYLSDYEVVDPETGEIIEV